MADNSKQIDDIINSTFNQLKNIVDANTVIGKTIKINEDIFIIPVSRISVGLVSGGGSITKKNNTTMGTSTGFNIVPIGFVSINNSVLSFMSVNTENNTKDLIDNLFKLSENILSKEVEDYEK
jgi:uncharacterized spore protein YtfJ